MIVNIEMGKGAKVINYSIKFSKISDKNKQKMSMKVPTVKNNKTSNSNRMNKKDKKMMKKAKI